MKFNYGAFDGEGFATPDSLFPEPKVMQFILQYGDKALEALEQLDSEGEQAFIQQMIDAGLLEVKEDGQGSGKFKLTPRMVKGIQHRALLDIFSDMRQGTREGHETRKRGRTGERSEGSKAYEFGDPLSELNLAATMQRAMQRQVRERSETDGVSAAGVPIGINSSDFELYVTEGTSDCATVILLDMSGSMMRYGRFYQAKRVALGMQALLNSRFPQDTLDFVGFYSLADQLREADLPLVMPKPVSVRDYEVRVRVPMDEARANPQAIPQHFTNLQLGLRTARQILSRRGAANKQIFVITDGQPTAHVQPNEAGEGEMLYLLYPPTEQTSTITLKEALKCQQQGIRMATFALIEDYWGMDWLGFVDQLTRLTHGIAYYCASEDLSSTVIESYLSGKKAKKFVG